MNFLKSYKIQNKSKFVKESEHCVFFKEKLLKNSGLKHLVKLKNPNLYKNTINERPNK